MRITTTWHFYLLKNINGIQFGYGYEFMNRNDATAIQGGTHEFVLRFYLITTLLKRLKI